MEPWKFKPARDLGLGGLDRLRSYHRETGLITSLIRLAWWGALRALFRVWNRLRIEGLANLPAKPPFLLAANHSSHLDTLMMMSMLPLAWRDRVFPIAAKDVFFESHGVAAFGAVFVNAMPLGRDRARAHDMRDLRELLAQQPAVFILFPEGTRTRDGQMGPFKPGIGRLVAATDVPVVPCFIEGAYAAMPAGRRFPRPGPLRLTIGTPLDFRDCPDNREGWGHVATAVREAVTGLAPKE